MMKHVRFAGVPASAAIVTAQKNAGHAKVPVKLQHGIFTNNS
jgi:hypothetical protein